MPNFSLTADANYVFKLDPQFQAHLQLGLTATGYMILGNNVPSYVPNYDELGSANPSMERGMLHRLYFGASGFVEIPEFAIPAAPADQQTSYGLAAHVGYARSFCFSANPRRLFSPDSQTHQNVLSCRSTFQAGLRADFVFNDRARKTFGPELIGRFSLGSPGPNYFTVGGTIYVGFDPTSGSAIPLITAGLIIGLQR